MTTYFTFIRTAKNWQEFSSGEKRVVEQDLSIDDAIAACKEWNDNRTDDERASGTMLEYAETGYGSNLVYD